MGVRLCQYCKEEIKADAILCKHCHSRLRSTREDRILWALARAGSQEAAMYEDFYCELRCKRDTKEGTPEREECMRGCREEMAITYLLERMTREFTETFIDVVWEHSGKIDPKPLEKAVRERFSHPPDK